MPGRDGVPRKREVGGPSPKLQQHNIQGSVDKTTIVSSSSSPIDVTKSKFNASHKRHSE